jgi:dTDP-4-amino-4,6-dideoxygalactose transaminase
MTAPAASPSVSQAARPFLHGPEQDAVSEVLLSGQYGNGPLAEAFEKDVAAFLGVPDVVAVASGTAALHIGLLAAGIGPGDEVLVPSLTFCASIQAIRATGACPRFTEVSPDTLCVQTRDVLEAITPATRAVMPVLYGGRAVDLTSIQDVLDAHRIMVIQDAAHAFGSRCGPDRVGSTGALTCFSFDPIKNLTCGEGGAIVPRNEEEATSARRLRGLGIAQSAAQRSLATSYEVDGFGLRAHLPSINAAIGRVQLQNFATVEARRKELWRAYQAGLQELHGVVLIDVDVDYSVPFNCVVRVLRGRDDVFRRLRDRGIGAGVHYPPNHLQPAFAAWRRSLPVTESLGQQILSLPFHPGMDDEDVHHVVSALEQALRSSASEIC